MFGSVPLACRLVGPLKALAGLAAGFNLIVALALVSCNAMAQAKTESAPTEAPGKPRAAARPAMTQGNAVPPLSGLKRETGAPWAELSPEQQASLRPLANSWSNLNADQKRKWIALSRNHASLSTQEQSRVHGRMSEWASLSPSDRNQARFNYSGFRDLSADEKSAQWEAYQSLSPEQKKSLAKQRPAKSGGAAIAATDAKAGKLTPQPELLIEQPSTGKRRAKPKLVPGDRVDANTLLPQQP